MKRQVFVAFGIVLTAYVSPVALNTTSSNLNIWECAPRRWWNEVKRLGGMQSATRTDPTSVLKRFDSGPDSSLKALANTINNAFLAPMNSFSPLHPEASGDVQHTNPPTVTEFRVLKKLTRLNPAKASGPDGIPACLERERRHTAQVVSDILNC